MQTFRKLRSLLTVRERRNSLVVLALMLVLGPLEAAGVASVAPLLAVIINPGIVHGDNLLGAAYKQLQFSDVNAFLLFLAAVAFVLVVSRIIFATVAQYVIVRYSTGLTYSLTTRLLETYLQKPYAWFLNRHSVELGKSILSEVEEVITGTLVPALQLFACVITALSVTGVLIAANPPVAVSVIFAFGAALYGRLSGRPQLSPVART